MTHQVQRDGVMTFIKEVDINQIWLLGHSPWVNANKKPNGKWINNITKEGPFLICVGVLCGHDISLLTVINST